MKTKYILLTILTLNLLTFQTSCSDNDNDLKGYYKLRKSLVGNWSIEDGKINVKCNYEDVSEFIYNTLQTSLTEDKQSYQMTIQQQKDANGELDDIVTDNLDNYGLCSLGLENTMNVFYNKKDLYWKEGFDNKKITLKYEDQNQVIYSLQGKIDKKERMKELVSKNFSYNDIEIFLAEITYTLAKK